MHSPESKYSVQVVEHAQVKKCTKEKYWSSSNQWFRHLSPSSPLQTSSGNSPTVPTTPRHSVHVCLGP